MFPILEKTLSHLSPHDHAIVKKALTVASDSDLRVLETYLDEFPEYADIFIQNILDKEKIMREYPPDEQAKKMSDLDNGIIKTFMHD